ncbi:MAG: hypothetical protein PUC50_03400 [Bacteroidales bacterium]|nr:hypothetical protein [Bacteroidales bacterium]
MTAEKIKLDTINILMGINSKELLTKVFAYINTLIASKVKTEKNRTNFEEMTDNEFLDYFSSLPKNNLMTADEMNKIVYQNRNFGTTRIINYQTMHDEEVSD